jgi:hypothetical protein
MDDGMTFTTVTQRLAPVFVASNARTHMLFIRMKLPIPDHTAKPNPDTTKEGRESLKLFMETMVQIDPTSILYKWQQTKPDKRDACVRSTHLPTTITGLQVFMNGFRPKPEGGAMWGGLRIGFNSDEADFFANLQEEGRMHDFWSKKAPLQTDTNFCGFLYLSLESMAAELFAVVTNDWIARTALKRKTTPITIAYEYRSIWDDGLEPRTSPLNNAAPRKPFMSSVPRDFRIPLRHGCAPFSNPHFQAILQRAHALHSTVQTWSGRHVHNKHEKAVQKYMKHYHFWR